jgi:hypothetical protein
MTKLLGFLALAFIMLFGPSVGAQQLLIIKKGSVSFRYNPGDEIYFELKDQKQIHHTTIQNLREFYFTTVQGDTIQYQRIALLAFRNDARKKYGMSTAIAGAVLLGVYGLNSIAFDPNTPAMRGLRLVGVLGIASGAIIYLTADKKMRLTNGRRLKYVTYDSPLYR